MKTPAYHPQLHNRPTPPKKLKDSLTPEQRKMLANLQRNIGSNYQK